MIRALQDRTEIAVGDSPLIDIAQKSYRLRLAASPSDVQAALRLRFLVLNLELNEGLATAFDIGCDTDQLIPCAST